MMPKDACYHNTYRPSLQSRPLPPQSGIHRLPGQTNQPGNHGFWLALSVKLPSQFFFFLRESDPGPGLPPAPRFAVRFGFGDSTDNCYVQLPKRWVNLKVTLQDTAGNNWFAVKNEPFTT
jgi:hypothetical protein